MSCELTSKDVIYKQPSETLNVAMDFTEWLKNGETLSSPSASIDPSGVTISNVSISGNKVAFTLTGGTAGTYRVEVQVTTSESEILTGDGILKVRDR